MSENIKQPSTSLEADTTTAGPDSSVDDVFEMPTKQQMAGGLNEERKEVEYETGPFSVQHQKRIDSTTYVVKERGNSLMSINFQQCGILTSKDNESVQPPFKL